MMVKACKWPLDFRSFIILFFFVFCGGSLIFSCGPRTSDPEPSVTNNQNTPIPLPSDLDCPSGTNLTWDNFAEQYVRRYCSGCHAASLVDDERSGAPAEIVFDTHEDALSLRIEMIRYASANNAPMPPGIKVPDDERALIREWLKCGAPN